MRIQVKRDSETQLNLLFSNSSHSVLWKSCKFEKSSAVKNYTTSHINYSESFFLSAVQVFLTKSFFPIFGNSSVVICCKEARSNSFQIS